ncbi:MAG: hypothetical protein HKM04_05880, partial [Legionellales bacterium]|nr:hypothetical protein [Legionellales bacterium]
VLLYFYLTRVLGVNKDKAKLIAEATANKDGNAGKYFEINEDKAGNVVWGYRQCEVPLQKNIYQKIIHDTDCLDIIRARAIFDAKYLDFYQEIASQNNSLALEEMAHLILEARSLIEIQGDSFQRADAGIKKKYENENAYYRCMGSIDENTHHILHTVLKESLSEEELRQASLVDLTPWQAEKGLDENNMKSALREGRIFGRGIASPSSLTDKYPDESNAALEIRKTQREIGIATRSNSKEKKGNPLRSVSMLGYGAGVYSSAGFLIVAPVAEAVSEVAEIDIGTGMKKKKYKNSIKGDVAKEKLFQLHEKLKLGGGSIQFKGMNFTSIHNEILYDTNHYDAVYYSNDPNHYNAAASLNPYSVHVYSPILQAVYLQKQYQLQYQEMKTKYLVEFGEQTGTEKFIERFGSLSSLPLFEYSGIHNKIRRVEEVELTDENLIAMWTEMCTDYLKKEENKNKIYSMSIKEIKMYSMYSNRPNLLFTTNSSADENYPAHLRQKIDFAINRERQKIIDFQTNEMAEKINAGELSIFSGETFKYLLNNPLLNEVCKDKISSEIAKMLDLADSQFFFNEKTADVLSIDLIQKPSLRLGEKITVGELLIPMFFDTVAVKLYILAKKYNFHDVVDIIKQRALDRVKKAVAEINQKISDGTFLKSPIQDRSFIKFTAFISTFDIFSDEIADEVNSKCEFFIDRLTSALFENPRGYGLSYFWIIEEMMSIEILKEKTKSCVLDKIECIAPMLSEGVTLYFQFCRLFNRREKKEMMNMIDKKIKKGHIEDRLEQISGLFPFNDNNLDLFELIMNKMDAGNCEMNMKNWCKLIMINLKKMTPGDRFSPSQMHIIENKWQERCQSFLKAIDAENYRDSLIQMVTVLDNNIQLKIELPLDTLTEKFNDCLGNFLLLKKEGDELDSKTLLLIEALDQKLPFHEGRVASINHLFETSETSLVSSICS